LVIGLAAGFHATIGITPPTEKQLRWVIVAWIASVQLIGPDNIRSAGC
jgi:hypothetical protein